MGNVAFKIANIPNVASATRKSLPFATVSGATITIQSQLAQELPLNEHLVWLWGILKNERRYLKALQAEGASLEVHAGNVRVPFEVKPNGAEMLHLLGASLIVGKNSG